MVTDNYRRQRGFSTVEILVATSILVVVFSAVILLVLGSQKLSVDTQTNHEAQLLGEKSLEEGRAAALADFSSNQNFTGTQTVGALTYNISRSQSFISPCVKSLTARVEWSVEGRPQYVTSTTQITSPAEAIALGGDCNVGNPPGGSFEPWEWCADYGQADLNPNGQEGTDIDAFQIGSTRYIALSSSHSNDVNNDFWIYSMSGANLTFQGSLDLGEGLNAVNVARDSATGTYYAFAASNENQNQLRVISLATITSPTQVAQLTFTGSGNGFDVQFYQGFVYIAAGNDIHKINVSTPGGPILVSSFNAGGPVNKLAVAGSYIYAATSDNNGELKIVNISSMTSAGTYNATGNENGTSVYVLGDTVYLGTERSNSHSDLYILNVTTPSSITVLGSQSLNHNPNSKLVDVIVSGPIAFVASDSSNDEFEVWNVSNPTNIFQQCAGGQDDVHVSQAAVGLDFLDNVAYGAIRSQDALHTMFDPKNPPQ
jgi:Tfp pilus assembly protein PilV